MLIVEQSTVTQIMEAPNFGEMVLEYQEEALTPGMPTPSIRFDAYAALEALGILSVFSALRDGQLVGMITVLASRIPHYDRVLATTESFFVSKPHRSSGAGLQLLRLAEAKAREVGARGLLVSAPCGGVLGTVLPRVGYKSSSVIFYKVLADG